MIQSWTQGINRNLEGTNLCQSFRRCDNPSPSSDLGGGFVSPQHVGRKLRCCSIVEWNNRWDFDMTLTSAPHDCPGNRLFRSANSLSSAMYRAVTTLVKVILWGSTPLDNLSVRRQPYWRYLDENIAIWWLFVFSFQVVCVVAWMRVTMRVQCCKQWSHRLAENGIHVSLSETMIISRKV